MGASARLDEAIADFAEAYAEQTERDYAALQAAVESGRIKAQTGIRGRSDLAPYSISRTEREPVITLALV
jgi:hypothetical protein